MTPFTVHEGIVAPLKRSNVDTDQIIPKQFLKRIERTGFGQFLFYDWRFFEDGHPREDFFLNNVPYNQASILLSSANFGCGSSREHAPWALQDFGFRVLIAPSFADIFYNNCFQTGILPIVLPESQVNHLFDVSHGDVGLTLRVDLESQIIHNTVHGISWGFTLDQERRRKLLLGLDEIGETLLYEEDISLYEAQHSVTPAAHG